jgi:thiol:disulfide interchange protein
MELKMKYVFVALLALLIACTPAKQEWTAEEMAEMEKEHSATMSDVLSGGASKYYNWDKAKFDQAVAEGKTIYLEFSADWCPACQSQEPHLIAGFAELNDPNVVGFKIHYKDGQTTDEHTGLAKQYGIAYQHTKVVLKNGKQVLKSPEAWDKSRFLAEMRKL